MRTSSPVATRQHPAGVWAFACAFSFGPPSPNTNLPTGARFSS